MAAPWFVDPLPCCRCGHKPSLLFDEGPPGPRRMFLRCLEACGGRGVVGMDYTDPERLPPRERLRLVRAGRLVTADLARATLARRWNARQGA